MEFLEDLAQARAVMANDRRIMDSGKTEVLEEHVGPGGELLRILLSTKTPLRDDTGQIIGLVGISQDITDRRPPSKNCVTSTRRSRPGLPNARANVYAGTLAALARASSAIVSTYQNRYRHKDGTYRWIEWNAAREGHRIHASGRHVTA